jgi:hypothetical protein
MIVRIAALLALIALFSGTVPAPVWAQQGASAPIPPPEGEAASSMSLINPTAGPNPAPAMGAAAQRNSGKILGANATILVNAREHRETKALNWLEAAGDNDFTDLRRDGSHYRVTVIRDGMPQVVTVDPDSGAIAPAE